MLTTTIVQDEELFGWDDTPGIVSVWADREGRALVWRRVEGRVVCEPDRFSPWLFAAHLDDLTTEGRPVPDSIQVLPLAGPTGTYRYRLAARSGRALERAILAGASQRLGQTIARLADLETDYLRVGPVEQYLMATGRVYFRGLDYTDLHRLQFDLETTALDARHGRIFMVAVRDSRGLALTFDAPTPGDEARLITDLCALIRERDPDIIENHNLFGFDLPFLEGRAAALGIPLALGRPPGPPLLERYADGGSNPYNGWGRAYHEVNGGNGGATSPLLMEDEGSQTTPDDTPGQAANEGEATRRARYSLAGRELIDTLDAVRRHDFVARDLPSHRLKDVARHFGVASPERVYVAGADVYATYRQDPARIRKYALDDVTEVDNLSQRLMGAAFALASMAPRRYERVASAGPATGILEPMLIRAYVRAGAALPRYAPYRGGQHEGGAAYLFATGVAEHVAKADMASLYPSIMRTYRIGPDCDRLGVLLSIVDRMTDLRLTHKAAMRTAPPGSLEAGRHNAIQAAMKLLINSAYGYMGAGSIALFADAHAADEVTRHGRELLGQVVEGLRGRGVALIEADTDGVFFATPTTWTEADERALVTAVGASLPQGIYLEYEGRYQAMFSHEVKNYALLTYDGRLIVRGVALKSSRSEPFGERLLLKALRCVMTGDVVGARQAYLDTQAALRGYDLSVHEVATRVRLSKSAKVYLQTRSRQREPQYEALLAAGRTHWSSGERVRFYRRRDGAYVWLPDKSDDAMEEETRPRDYDIDNYLQVLLQSYAGRLRKAFAPEDFQQLFRIDGQAGLFDQPIDQIQPVWIRPA